MKSIFIKMNYFYDLLSALKSAHYKIIHTFMRDFWGNHYTFMRDFLGNHYTFMRDFWRGEGFGMKQNML